MFKREPFSFKPLPKNNEDFEDFHEEVVKLLKIMINGPIYGNTLKFLDDKVKEEAISQDFYKKETDYIRREKEASNNSLDSAEVKADIWYLYQIIQNECVYEAIYFIKEMLEPIKDPMLDAEPYAKSILLSKLQSTIRTYLRILKAENESFFKKVKNAGMADPELKTLFSDANIDILSPIVKAHNLSFK